MLHVWNALQALRMVVCCDCTAVLGFGNGCVLGSAGWREKWCVGSALLVSGCILENLVMGRGNCFVLGVEGWC